MSVTYLTPRGTQYNLQFEPENTFDDFIRSFKHRHGPMLDFISQKSAPVFFTRTREWKEFRLAVLAERGSHCALCNTADAPIEVHHIEERAAKPERAFDPSNVVVLCQDCHDGVHLIRRSVRSMRSQSASL